MSEWREIELDELCELIVDSEHKTAPKSVNGAHPLVRTTNLGPARVDYASAQRVDEATYKLWTRRAAPAEGDIILAREAPVGGVGRVPDGVAPVLGQRTVLLRPDPEKADSYFLLYRLASPDLQARMNEMAIGATVPHLNMSDIRSFPVPMPSTTDVQRRIGRVLRMFDELIEINERRIDILDDLARSLYREWFVRFRFPGHDDVELVESELGPIPAGWSIVPLFDAADVAFGFSFKSPRFAEEGPFAVVRIRDIPSLSTLTFTDEEAPERYRIVDGDVLIGMDGAFHLRQWAGGDAWQNQRVTRIRPRPDLSAQFLMLAIERPIKEWNAAITGTTVAHLGKHHLEQIKVAIPPPELREFVRECFDGLSSNVISLHRWSKALASTREVLLPRLVAGRLDISTVDLGDLLPTEVA